MTREEAIKILREAHDNVLFSVRTALETLIPELQESDDERMLQTIIRGFENCKRNGMDTFYNIKIDDILVYLEKQKETGIQWLKSDDVKNPDKPYIDKAGMFYTTDGRMCHASKLEKQKEQKPVGDGTREKIVSRATSEKQVVLVSESDGNAEIGWDTRSLEDAKNLLEYGISFLNKQLGVKPAELSEEDKAMLAKVEQIVLKHWNSLSDSFYHKYDDENQDAESCYDWLKSLHGRFGLQPKQEWSEEDEEHLKSIISTIEMCMKDCEDANAVLGYYDSDISWLKSLRPSWKPSKEQMKALKNSAYGIYQNGDGPVLRGLYEQLKKLM